MVTQDQNESKPLTAADIQALINECWEDFKAAQLCGDEPRVQRLCRIGNVLTWQLAGLLATAGHRGAQSWVAWVAWGQR